MKTYLYFVISSLLITSCKSDKISDKSIELSNKAVNALSFEKYTDALKYSEEAIKIDKKNYNAYTIKAQMLIKENKLNEAEKTIQKQLEVKPDFAEGWTFKGMINDLQGNQNQAKSDYQKGIDLFEQRILKTDFNKQINVTNKYLNLILIGDEKSKSKMSEIETEFKNDKLIYDLLISLKEHSKKEVIEQMLTE